MMHRHLAFRWSFREITTTKCYRKFYISQSFTSVASMRVKTKTNESNSTAGAVQVEANLQKELSVHLHYRKLECCYK